MPIPDRASRNISRKKHAALGEEATHIIFKLHWAKYNDIEGVQQMLRGCD